MFTNKFLHHHISSVPYHGQTPPLNRPAQNERCSWQCSDSDRVLVIPAESLPTRGWCWMFYAIELQVFVG